MDRNELSELIHISYDSENNPTVSGRELHKALGIHTRYTQWFKTKCSQYGFQEGKDYWTKKSKNTDSGRTLTDHVLTICTAKEISLTQKTEIGRQFRQYFRSLELIMESREAIMDKALMYYHQKREREEEEHGYGNEHK